MTKIYLFLLFLLGLTTNSFSQTFPTENVLWDQAYIGFGGFPLPEYFVLCGDTTISNQTYNKLYQIYPSLVDENHQLTYIGGTRSEGEQVYLRRRDNEEILFYDFSLEVGDSVQIKSAYPDFFGDYDVQMEVSEVGTTMVGGMQRKTIHFIYNFTHEEIWIEGIGSTDGLITRGLFVEPFISDYEPFLVCFKQDNITQYQVDDEFLCSDFTYEGDCQSTTSTDEVEVNIFTVAPNPFRETIRIHFENRIEGTPQVQLFDLAGKGVSINYSIGSQNIEIKTALKEPGIYFLQLVDERTNQVLLRKKLVSL